MCESGHHSCLQHVAERFPKRFVQRNVSLYPFFSIPLRATTVWMTVRCLSSYTDEVIRWIESLSYNVALLSPTYSDIRSIRSGDRTTASPSQKRKAIPLKVTVHQVVWVGQAKLRLQKQNQGSERWLSSIASSCSSPKTLYSRKFSDAILRRRGALVSAAAYRKPWKHVSRIRVLPPGLQAPRAKSRK